MSDERRHFTFVRRYQIQWDRFDYALIEQGAPLPQQYEIVDHVTVHGNGDTPEAWLKAIPIITKAAT